MPGKLKTKSFADEESAVECPLCGRKGLIGTAGHAWRWRHAKTGRVSKRAGLPMFLVEDLDECWLSRRHQGSLVSVFLTAYNHRSRSVLLEFPWGRSERLEEGGSALTVWVPQPFWLSLRRDPDIKANRRYIDRLQYAGTKPPEESSGPAWKIRFQLDLVPS